MFIQALILLLVIISLYLIISQSKSKEPFTLAEYWKVPWCVCKRDINIV